MLFLLLLLLLLLLLEEEEEEEEEVLNLKVDWVRVNDSVVIIGFADVGNKEEKVEEAEEEDDDDDGKWLDLSLSLDILFSSTALSVERPRFLGNKFEVWRRRRRLGVLLIVTPKLFSRLNNPLVITLHGIVWRDKDNEEGSIIIIIVV